MKIRYTKPAELREIDSRRYTGASFPEPRRPILSFRSMHAQKKARKEGVDNQFSEVK